MEIKVRFEDGKIAVKVKDCGTTIEYDPMECTDIFDVRKKDVRPEFVEMLVQAAVDAVEFRKQDTDTSDAIRRLFDRLPGIKKDQLLSELVAEHTDLNESIEALQEKIAELEARVAVYKFGEEE